MRRLKIIILCAAAHCAETAGRPASVLPTGGVDLPDDDESTGGAPDAPRLDLPDDGGPLGSSSSGEASTGVGTTGEDPSTGGAEASTGDPPGTTGNAGTTAEPDPGSSSGSRGEAPPVCGDGACDPAEAAVPCYGPGWCPDCAKAPACLSPCPCTAEAAAFMSFCALKPGLCPATAPGGYCDPNGDGNPNDGDWTLGYEQWSAKPLTRARDIVILADR